VTSFSFDFFVFASTFFKIYSRVERVRNIPAFQVFCVHYVFDFSSSSSSRKSRSEHRAPAATAPAAVRALPAWPLSVAGQYLLPVSIAAFLFLLSRLADSDQRANVVDAGSPSPIA
jgi:hypothetical protein